MFPFLFIPLEFLTLSHRTTIQLQCGKFCGYVLFSFNFRKEKVQPEGGKKRCLMVERTLLTNESHGSLASSQRSHEGCVPSPQHSLNHVLPAAPRGQQLSRARFCPTLPTVNVWPPGKEKALSQTILVPLVSSPFPWALPEAMLGLVVKRAMFQVRCEHAFPAACGQKESLKVTTWHLHCVFSFQSAVAALALLPLPYLQALPVLLLPH